ACFRDELDNLVKEEDGEWICFLGGNNSSGIKKYQGSNSSDGGNTGDGVKIDGGVIGSGDGISAEANLRDNYYGKQYYHAEQLNASLMGRSMGAKQGAGFGIGGKIGKGYTSWVVTERG
ncbi:hypothetical protein Tco_1095844, partial [Tanacetum coccineum]